MDKPVSESLAERVERLERENGRWKWAAGITAVTAGVLLALGGWVSPRVVLGQPAARVRMQYTRSEEFALADMNGVLNRMAADGWEVIEVVPTGWGTTGEAGGYFTKFVAQSGSSYTLFVAVARRPGVPAPAPVPESGRRTGPDQRRR